MASDDFNRADGGLGANWTGPDIGSGVAFTISSFKALGASPNGLAMRTAEIFANDQLSAIASTSDALGSGSWIGPSVRMTGGGRNMYLGIYFNNGGSYILQLYRRVLNTFTQLTNTIGSDTISLGGAQPAGTVFKLVAQGTRVAFSMNGVEQIVATDSTQISGAPGMMTAEAAFIDNWEGEDVVAAGNFAPVILGRGAA